MMNALQAFDFEAKPVRTMMLGESPWFVLGDVCQVLEIANSREAAARLAADEKADVGITDTSSNGVTQRRTMNVVNESGLYALIFTSRKEVARRFRKWVTADVLPALRQRGVYSMVEAAEDRDGPVSADGKLWGVGVGKVNAAARMIGVVGRIYGPEAARALYEAEPACQICATRRSRP